jgi:predicted ATPase
MSYKILVTGTLDVGKTTLLNEFAGDSNVVVVREVAQDIIDEHGYAITQTPEFQDMVFAEQLRREAEAEQQGAGQRRGFRRPDPGRHPSGGDSQ